MIRRPPDQQPLTCKASAGDMTSSSPKPCQPLIVQLPDGLIQAWCKKHHWESTPTPFGPLARRAAQQHTEQQQEAQ